MRSSRFRALASCSSLLARRTWLRARRGLRRVSVVSALVALLVSGLALGACSEDVGTSIRISLVYKDSWRLGDAEVIASAGQETAPIAREMLVLIPDEAAGEVMPLEVWGTREGMRIAHGEAVALPRKGQTVGATIVLERLPCGVFCEVGELRCDGGGIGTCVVDGDDCLTWSEPTDCPAATPFCTDGECRVDCDDECVEGTGVCVDATTQRRCGQFDADVCRDYGANEACPASQTCYAGRCAAACSYAALSNAALPATTDGAHAPSIVSDAAGGLHAIYSANGSRDLTYLRKPRGGSWTTPVAIGASGEDPALAIARDGTLHVAFYSPTGTVGLRYGMRDAGGTWSFALVEGGADVGASHAIAIDDDGVVHLVYQDTDGGMMESLLRHAVKNGTSFALETIDTQLGYRCDLFITGKTLHVSSFSDANNVWYSGKPAGGAWASARAVDLADDQLSANARTSLVVDRAGTIHLVYTDAYSEVGVNSDWLQYTSRAMSSAVWRAPVSIDRATGTGGRTGALPELALDPFDGLHVAYRSISGTPALQYAYRPAGVSTTFGVVTPPATSGLEPTATVSSDGGLHILSSARPQGLIETSRPCQ